MLPGWYTRLRGSSKFAAPNASCGPNISLATQRNESCEATQQSDTNTENFDLTSSYIKRVEHGRALP